MNRCGVILSEGAFILQRRATPRIVANGCVPLLLEHAVAYTGNVRKETLASALGCASADTQTIMLTLTISSPNRC